MRRFLSMALSAIVALSAMVGCSYDDTALWREMEQVKDRVTSLEEAVIKTNEDIVALQAIVDKDGEAAPAEEASAEAAPAEA